MVGTGVGHYLQYAATHMLNDSSKYDSSKDETEGTRA